MEVKVKKWGKNLAVCLPSTITKQMQVRQGDSLIVNLNPEGQLILAPKPTFNKAEFIKELVAIQKSLPETASVIDAMRNQSR
jgi:antitoxin component of MazEF toxin-antitoxin module